MSRLLLIALASFWLTGCFVFEELRKGDAIIEAHSSRWRKKKEADETAQVEAAAAKAAKAGPPIEWAKTKERLADWWEEAIEEEPIEPDPDDHIVGCEVKGQVRFTRKSQCEIYGGRTTGVYSKTKDGS
jgi:hypothetical protein